MYSTSSTSTSSYYYYYYYYHHYSYFLTAYGNCVRVVLETNSNIQKIKNHKKFQIKAAPTFAHGSKNSFSHIGFNVQILSKWMTSNSVIFSFSSYFGWYWLQKIFQKSKTSCTYDIFWDTLHHITWKKHPK